MQVKYINQLALSFLAVLIGFMLITFFRLPEPFVWALELIILYVGYSNIKRYNLKSIMDPQGYTLTSIFIYWLFFCFIRGFYDAHDYWSYKFVFFNLILTCFYIVIYLSVNIYVVQRYFQLYFYFIFPLILIIYFLDQEGLKIDYVPFSILMIFVGIIPNKQRLILIGVIIFFFITIIQRNDLIKMSVTALIGITFNFFPKLIIKYFIKPARIFLFCLPLILLTLGISGIFNIFKMDDYIRGDYELEIRTSNGKEVDDLKADTRTFIFKNVFFTLNKYDAWLIGKGTANGDEGTEGFFEKENKVTVRGRYGNEVGIMDILLWYGIIGVILYFLIYLRASYVAIYKSKNRYAKAVGLYISFLWVWSFVWEKPWFETFFMMDLLLLGLVFSNRFRLMSDYEVQLWVEGIFTTHRKRISA